jgi:hypothetical protein
LIARIDDFRLLLGLIGSINLGVTAIEEQVRCNKQFYLKLIYLKTTLFEIKLRQNGRTKRADKTGVVSALGDFDE